MSLPTVIERFSALHAFTQLLAAMSESRAVTHVAGLAGSADAVLVAALAERERNRLIVVVTDQLSDAERWLADLESITGRDGISLYPPREGFGEVEPHAEVAGERVETLERMTRGGVRILLTTARAVRGLTNADGSEVQLFGHAVIVREPFVSGGLVQPEQELRSEFLHLFADTEAIRTHLPVVLLRDTHDRFAADSMDYDNLARVIHLKGRVHGEIQPRKKP